MGNRLIKDSGKVFRDPVHHLIRIDPDDAFILDLIDTPEFQRLRRIRQLGVSYLTYHGAEHTRFTHSLGVFNFAQRMIHSLMRRYGEESEVAIFLKDNRREIITAALLHDIGHGPFSHMIERAFKASSPKHELITSNTIRNQESNINHILLSYGINAEEVASIIDGTSPNRLSRDIVSSQLDADRMDYLLRDSYCTGVHYGHFDAEWIINSICIGREPASSKVDPGPTVWRLCLDKDRGKQSVEQLIIARQHMNEQVYFHRVTRGYEAILLMLFDTAIELAERDELPAHTPADITGFFQNRGDVDPDIWVRIDEAQLITAMHIWSRSILRNHAMLVEFSSAFLNRNRILDCVKMQPDDIEKYADLSTSDLKRDRDWHIDQATSSVYKGVMSNSKSALSNDEEVDNSSESILLSDGEPGSVAQQAEHVSDLLAALQQGRSSMKRIYYRKEHASRMSELGFQTKLRRAAS